MFPICCLDLISDTSQEPKLAFNTAFQRCLNEHSVITSDWVESIQLPINKFPFLEVLWGELVRKFFSRFNLDLKTPLEKILLTEVFFWFYSIYAIATDWITYIMCPIISLSAKIFFSEPFSICFLILNLVRHEISVFDVSSELRWQSQSKSTEKYSYTGSISSALNNFLILKLFQCGSLPMFYHP